MLLPARFQLMAQPGFCMSLNIFPIPKKNVRIVTISVLQSALSGRLVNSALSVIAIFGIIFVNPLCMAEERLAVAMHEKVMSHGMACVDCHDAHYGQARYFLK